MSTATNTEAANPSLQPTCYGWLRQPAQADELYGANRLTMVVAKSQAGRLSYISEFIEEAKASGLVQRAIERGGSGGYQAVSSGNPNTQK
jgi:hypothetical protein